MWPPDVAWLEPFDIEPPDLPPRSTLFALAPAALGTDRVESLTSYITRLARAHAVGPRRLFREQLITAFPDAARADSPAKRATTACTWDGYGLYAEALATATVALTTVPEVRLLTLLPLQNVLPAFGQSVIGKHPRWCGKCLSEMLDAGEGVWRPLTWSMELYRVCHRHQTSMLETCGRCGKRQLFLPYFPDLVRCVHCNEALTSGHASDGPVSELDLWISVALADLVARLPQLDGVASRESFVVFLRRAIDEVAGGSAEAFCGKIGLGPSSIKNWITKGRPSLRFILSVAYGADVLPATMLLGERCKANLRRLPRTVSSRAKGRRLSVSERKMMTERIAAIVRDPSDARPLHEVCEALEVSRWSLSYWFPSECEVICRKHAAARSLAAARKMGNDYGVILRLIGEMVERGEYPARKKINLALRRHRISLASTDMLLAYKSALAGCECKSSSSSPRRQ